MVRETHLPLVPKYNLGTGICAKMSLATKCVPKLSLGTREKLITGNWELTTVFTKEFHGADF